MTASNRTHRRPGLLTFALLLPVAFATAPLHAQTKATPPSATAATATGPQTSPTAQQPAASETTPQTTPQGQAPSQEEPITTIQVQVNEVNLIFTVTDKKGRFITGLKRQNFGLLDDGRPPERSSRLYAAD